MKAGNKLSKFIVDEMVVFLSQVFVFFLVAVFTSDFLKSEQRLMKYSELKANDGSPIDLGFTFLAILVVIGIFAAFERIVSNENISHYLHEILAEIPKTIYFFGSSITGLMLAVSLFIAINPESTSISPEGFLALSLVFALMSFIYGCGASYLFKWKPRNTIKANK